MPLKNIFFKHLNHFLVFLDPCHAWLLISTIHFRPFCTYGSLRLGFRLSFYVWFLAALVSHVGEISTGPWLIFISNPLNIPHELYMREPIDVFCLLVHIIRWHLQSLKYNSIAVLILRIFNNLHFSSFKFLVHCNVNC